MTVYTAPPINLALDMPDRAALSLEIASVRLPDNASQLRIDDPEIERVLRAVLDDAGCAEDGCATVMAGTRDGRTVLLAPWLAQTVGLPIRIGEKVLWSLQLPSIRLTPTAQSGVRNESDAVALLEWLRRSSPDRAVVVTDVATESPLYAAVQRAPLLGYRITKNQTVKHLFHRFGESYAAFFDELGSKYRNQLRKKEKVFAARVGSDQTFKEYRRADEVKDFLDAAAAISRKTYQYRLFGESIDNDDASVRATQKSAQAGNFRSFVLWHGATPLCFVLGHQRADGTYEHRQTGYDPAWRDFAPGIYSNMLMLQRLYEHDRPLVLDFGSGDADYKRLFSNESRMSGNPVLIPRHPRYVLVYWLHERSIAFNEMAVQLLDRWGIKDWIKRRLRGAA